ncbi:hypothetical protein [Microcystis phage Mel-JY01]
MTNQCYTLTINLSVENSDTLIIVEQTLININNPFLSSFVAALDKLVPLQEHHRVSLNPDVYEYNKRLGNINDFECELLTFATQYDCDTAYISKSLTKSGYEDSDENDDYLCEFVGILYSENEWARVYYKDWKIN